MKNLLNEIINNSASGTLVCTPVHLLLFERETVGLRMVSNFHMASSRLLEYIIINHIHLPILDKIQVLCCSDLAAE